MHLVMPEGQAQSTSLVVVLVIVGVVGIGMYAWYGAALARLFPKLGSDANKGWIPLLNDAEIFVLGGVPAWPVALYFIPVLNIYALILRIQATSRINAAFGRGGGMTALATLLPPLWAAILASSQPLSVAGRIAPTTVLHRIPVDPLLPKQVPPPAVLRPASEPTPSPEAPVSGSQVRGASGGERLKPISPYLDATTPRETPVDRPAAAPAGPPAPPPAPAAPAPPAPPEPPAPPAFPATRALPTPMVAGSPWAPAASSGAQTAPLASHTGAPVPALTGVTNSMDGAQYQGLQDPFTPKLLVAEAASVAVAANDEAVVDEGVDGETVLVDRVAPTPWRLNVEGMGEFPLTRQHVLLGRKPTGTIDTQALRIPDTTRTVSKVHARLDLVRDEWVITDLNSTNGVIVIASDGTERLLNVGEAAPVPFSFILGKLEMSISFESPPA